MDRKNTARAQQLARREHVEASIFLHTIVETAARLRAARDFDGAPALRLDARWALLRAIERSGGCPSFSDVARMLRVTRQSARARILAAEKAGAVELFPDPHDRRALQVALTPSGRRALEAHRLPGIAWVFTLLSGLEPGVMEATGNVLRVIRRRLEQHEREMKQARHEAWRRDRR